MDPIGLGVNSAAQVREVDHKHPRSEVLLLDLAQVEGVGRRDWIVYVDQVADVADFECLTIHFPAHQL